MFVTINDYLMLFESAESRNQSKARKVCVSYGDTNPQKTTEYCRNLVSNIRQYDCKFLPAVCRMFFNREFEEDGKAAKLNSVIKYLEHHLDEYDNDLNGDSVDTIINRFKTHATSDIDKDKDDIGVYRQRNKEYEIVKISSYREAAKYSDYVTWCVTQSDTAYNNYTNGTGIFYFLLKDGYEDLEEWEAEDVGDTAPDGEYAMSMIAVSVNADGSLNTSTCRWNHEYGCNDKMFTTKELSDLLGGNFYDLCPPKDILKDWDALKEKGMLTIDELPLGYMVYMNKKTTPPECILVQSNKMIGNVYRAYDLLENNFIKLKYEVEASVCYKSTTRMDIYDLVNRSFIRRDIHEVKFRDSSISSDMRTLYENGFIFVHTADKGLCLYNITNNKEVSIGSVYNLYAMMCTGPYILINGNFYDYDFEQPNVDRYELYKKYNLLSEIDRGNHTLYAIKDTEYNMVSINGKIVSNKLYKRVNLDPCKYIVLFDGDNWDAYNESGEYIMTFDKLHLMFPEGFAAATKKELIVFQDDEVKFKYDFTEYKSLKYFKRVYVGNDCGVYAYGVGSMYIDAIGFYNANIGIGCDPICEYDYIAYFGDNSKFSGALCFHDMECNKSCLIDETLKVVAQYDKALHPYHPNLKYNNGSGVLVDTMTKKIDFFVRSKAIFRDIQGVRFKGDNKFDVFLNNGDVLLYNAYKGVVE